MSSRNNCNGCGDCLQNCGRCPVGCEFIASHNQNKKRINKEVRLQSSLYIAKKKGLVVSRIVGQSAEPRKLLQAGGPGDLISSGKSNLKEIQKVTYNMGSMRNRLSSNGKKGVDKKHGSYARFLARKTGGVLRQEQMPNVRKTKANIHQPRNRTNTNVSCKLAYNTTTKQHFPLGRYGISTSKISFSDCYSDKCCSQRIPQTHSCYLDTKYADKWNSGNNNITGAYGNNTQCVATKCRCKIYGS